MLKAHRIIQRYLFALLALAAPIAMVRAETRHHDTVPARAAKLADRYRRAVR